METLGSLVLAIAGVALGWVVVQGLMIAAARRRNGLVTVYEHETGLKIVRGVVTEELGPGRYATWPHAVEIERHDLRERSLTVQSQEVLTADKLPVRLSLLVGWKVQNAKSFRATHESPHSRLYEAAQVALRERAAQKPLDDIAADRGALQDGLAEVVKAKLANLSIEIVSVQIKDITLVGASKQAYADLWKAQMEGLAALERARGEQASLRALANAARMLKGNPELMNLRVLQALQAKPGQAPPSVILGNAPGLMPVSTTPAPMEGTDPPS
jgi:regulator of protease activity HflC (stomatin/prohibitin superfamily)